MGNVKGRMLLLFAAGVLRSMTIWASPEEQIEKNIRAHLQIKDYRSAYDEAVVGVGKYPHQKQLWEAYIQTLAKIGNENEMLSAWYVYTDKFPDQNTNHAVLESMAWGVIERASNSSSPLIRLLTMVAALLSQDAKGIEIVKGNLSDSNSLIRAIAVELSSQLRDEKIREGIYRLFSEESSWNVRLEAIKAVGKMHIEEAKPALASIIANNQSTAEEKAAAIESLVSLLDTADRESIWNLSISDRAGLRLLACQLIAHFDLAQDLDLIVPLLNDHCAEVRAAVLETIGLIRLETYQGMPISGLIASSLRDPDPKTAITAAWAMTLNDPVQGQKAFEPWLRHRIREVRLLAGAALAATGKYGYPLNFAIFKKTDDRFLKMNLAIGLIGQRVQTDLACEALFNGLNREKGKWMWKEEGVFRFLVPSKIRRDEDLLETPEAVDQLSRLEILNVLAMMKYPKAQEGIKKFLQERKWGITTLAAALLLTEGDELAIELVQALLKDPDQKVRVQAALVLALWGQGEDAIATLEQAYPDADWEMKERILEGIGRIASEKSIPFLVKRLQEPSQSMRIIAACGLLGCLYN